MSTTDDGHGQSDASTTVRRRAVCGAAAFLTGPAPEPIVAAEAIRTSSTRQRLVVARALGGRTRTGRGGAE